MMELLLIHIYEMKLARERILSTEYNYLYYYYYNQIINNWQLINSIENTITSTKK